MAMLASKAPRPTPGIGAATQSSQYPHGTTQDYRSHRNQPSNSSHGFLASPTESTFSERSEGPDSVRHWNEDQVAEWLRRINCAQYVELFKKNNITGEILMEMDQPALKEMGIKKIGDRVRIGSQAKLFRSREYSKPASRASNRESLAMLDTSFSSLHSASPRPLHSSNRSGLTSSSRSDKRLSRQFNGSDFSGGFGSAIHLQKVPSRPSSPLVDGRLRNYPTASPIENPRREAANNYFGHPSNSSQYATSMRIKTPQTAQFHQKQSPSMDGSVTNSSILPPDKSLIRVILEGGGSKVVNIEGCRTSDEIILKTLKKAGLNEAHVKNYCFYLLEGIDPDPRYSRRITDPELIRMCNDRTRVERGRLILRKVHAGEPDQEQLQVAANIIAQQRLQAPEGLILPNNPRSASKIEKITGEKFGGESLAPKSYPMSPGSQLERERQIRKAADELESSNPVPSPAARARKLKDFYGARPPSELIASDLTSYFPDVEKGEIDKTIRMSVRRSRRISRAANRLSIASNLSFASSLKDAPPLPTIADQWLKDSSNQRSIRPLSVVRLGVPQRSSSYRESVTSSVLEPLEEESPVEPNRKSYVSFGDNSGSDTVGDSGHGSYFDDGSSSVDPGDSLNKRLSQALAEDDEGSDEELTEYLEADSWENVKYMKGALIGQGSFGSVYLALHAVTGELMAVKQVEVPGSANTPMDTKRLNMVDALKHEIGLLRDLKHPNIVQYLGSNSDESHLNIFLEYVPGGSVATMLVNYGPLGEGLIANFVRQILTGLAYLHSKDIIHRDIKGANILVDNKGSVKISDFGISKRIETSTLLNTSGPEAGQKKLAAANRVSMQGSVFWMAPEVVKQTAYTRKADIWSLGCLIVEMFTGSHPHPNCTQLQAIFKIGGSKDASPTMPETAGKEAQDFLARTFEIDHTKRPTADELLLSGFCNPKA